MELNVAKQADTAVSAPGAGRGARAAAFDLDSVTRLLESLTTESGQSFVDLAQQSPLLLVFLRHAGCTFCREALADISQARQAIEAKGAKIVLVHMGDREAMEELLEKNALQDVERICDSGQVLYGAFGLRRGSVPQLAGFKVWWRGFAAGVLAGHGRGRPVADFRQMPGVFYVEKGIVARHFRHKSAADRPQYDALCSAVPRKSD